MHVYIADASAGKPLPFDEAEHFGVPALLGSEKMLDTPVLSPDPLAAPGLDFFADLVVGVGVRRPSVVAMRFFEVM